MSDHFAEATVRITPSLTGFKTDLEKQLKAIMAKVNEKPYRVKIAPALTSNFVGDLRRQVNAAVLQAQSRVKPIIIKTVIESPSRRQLLNVVQAPVSVAGRTGSAAAPLGPIAGNVSANQERINAGLARGAVLLGDVEVAEEKVTQARKRGDAASKQRETRAQQQARAEKFSAQATKLAANAESEALTKSTPALQAKSRLATINKAYALSEKGLETSLTKTTRAVFVKIKADQEAAIAAVRALETEKARAASQTPAVAPGLPRTVTSARATGLTSLGRSFAGLKEAQAASDKLGKSTKDLAGAQDVLRIRSHAASDAAKALTQAEKSQSENFKIIAKRNVDFAKQQVQASKDQVAAIKSQTRESAKQARSSEQFSRGGQASILSLAGIRGATLAASRSFLVGAAAITVFAKAVKSFADLETNLDVFRATTSATASQMAAVREEARKLGADLTLPSVSASDAAGAMVELAKAGLSVADSMSAARGVLELATAAAIDNAAATQLVANALNAFGLQGREAVAVADTFANAANLAQGSIADIGTAFQQAAAAGRQVGLSFQDTATFLTILAKNGLRGADAGTSLRTALIRLVNPSKKAAEAFAQLGIQVRDAQGQLRPDVFIQIANAAEKLGPAQRDATIALIGGQDAFRAVTILGRQSISSFLALRKSLREEGSAAALAAARTKGLHGAMDALQSTLETVGTTAAGHVGPALATMVRGVAAGVTALSQSDQVALSLNQSLTALGQTFSLLGSAMKGISAVALPAVNALARLATGIGVGNILAAVAAYRILPGVLKRAADGYKSLALAQKFFEANNAVSIRSVAGIRTLLASGAKSFNFYAIAAAVAAGGLVYLLTRQSQTEKATASLQGATERLAKAYGELNDAVTSLDTGKRSVQQLQTGLTQAVLNQQRARVALAQSNAPRGSNERRQQELDVLVATQDVTFATQDYNKAIKDLQATQEKQAAASDAIKKARFDEVVAVQRLLITEQIRSKLNKGSFGEEVRKVLLLKNTADAIGKLSQKNIASDSAEQQSLGRKQALIRGLILQTRNVNVKPILIQAIFKAPNLKVALANLIREMGITGVAAREEFIKGLLKFSGLGPALRKALLAELKPNIKKVIDDNTIWLEHMGTNIGAALGKGASEGFKANFNVSDAIATAMAQGASTPELLSVAKKSQAKAQAAFNKINTATKGGTFFTGDAQQKAFEDARDELNAANAEVERLSGEITSANKDAAQKIKDAQTKHNEEGQKIVDQILQGRKATILQRRITSAGLNEQLGDDLKTNRAWIVYLKHARDVIRKRLEAVGAAKSVISAAMKQINDLIFTTTTEIKRLAAEQKKNQEAMAQALVDRALERADLRIQIAEAHVTDRNANVAALLKAHRAKLQVIQKELERVRKQYGRNSLEWLRVKAAEQDEIKAINDLKGTTAKKNDAMSKLMFEFLQAQQGFTASLLGNLFPTSPNPTGVGGAGGVPIATGGGGGGIIGGTAISIPGVGSGMAHGGGDYGPGGKLQKAQATSSPHGSTAGQMSMLIHINKQMLEVLKSLSGATKHPGARTNEQRQAARGMAT